MVIVATACLRMMCLKHGILMLQENRVVPVDGNDENNNNVEEINAIIARRRLNVNFFVRACVCV